MAAGDREEGLAGPSVSEHDLPRVDTDDDFRELAMAMAWHWMESGLAPILIDGLQHGGALVTREEWAGLPEATRDKWRAILRKYREQRLP